MSQTRRIPREPENGRIAPGNWEADTQDIPLTGDYNPTVPISNPMRRPVVTDGKDAKRVPARNTPDKPRTTRIVPPTSATNDPIKSEDEWPVAILLVTGGRMKGTVLPVPPGRSTLGRTPDNRICMPDDPFVSKQAHITLTHFADEDDEVMVSPSQMEGGAGVVYLNDKPLLAPATLKHGDCIRLTNKKGNSNPTELRFIPICCGGEHPFSW